MKQKQPATNSLEEWRKNGWLGKTEVAIKFVFTQAQKFVVCMNKIHELNIKNDHILAKNLDG